MPSSLLLRSFAPSAALACLLACSAWGQAPWRSTLYPADWTPPTQARFETDRLIQDFSHAGYGRGEVEIPTLRGPIYDATTFGADPTGATDSTVAIQTAINAATAADAGVVYLPAGTYKVSPQGNNAWALRFTASHVVLRGAGRDRTFIFNDSFTMRSRHIIRVEGSSSGWSTVPAGSPQPRITADLLSPTTVIPVESTAGFTVGAWVILRADATDAFIAEHNMTDLWAGQGASLGGVMFHRQITAIDATAQRLTVDVPIRYYLKTRDNARVHLAVPHLEGVGLEDFSIGNRQHAASDSRTGWGEEDYNTEGNGSYDAHGSFAIAFRRVRNSWIRNVASYRPPSNTLDAHLLSNGILLEHCRGVTVQGCDFQRPLFGGGGGNGYMYRLQNSNECLVRDSAARFNRHGFVFSHMACSGNVIHGGIAQQTRVQVAGSGTTAGEGCDHHMHLSQSNLIDGVQLDQDFFTAHYRGTSGTPPQHGQTAVHTVYWNLVGLAYHSTKTFIVRSEQARYGYMIGTRGPAPGMTTTSGAAAARMAPVDHAEGAGLGLSLQPLSLYHDQLSRRLARVIIPPVPTAVTATGGLAQATLTWSPSSGATAYQVRRATASGGAATLLATTTATTFEDTTLPAGAIHHYVVSALNEAGESAPSAEVAVALVSAFQQDSGPDGVVSIEVEQFDVHVPQGGHAWTPDFTAGYSGEGALAATPNNGTTRDSAFTTTSPRLDYRVNFVRAGVHHVWIRGLGLTGNDDSLHAGLNGVALATSDRISGVGTTWGWRNTTTDGPVATIAVPSPGVHTINLWMREDGVKIDKLLLTTNAGYVPTGIGPAPSPRVGPAGPIPSPQPRARIVNLATRALVGGAAGTPITGFVIGGTGTKRVLVRAVGPGLAAFGLTGTIADPSIALVGGGTTLASNDNWNPEDAATFAAVGAFALPAGSRDAAVVRALSPGAYTTPVGAGGGSGIALLEIYDAEPANPLASLVNASTRAFVGTAESVLIPGLVIDGPGHARLLVRAIGPTLATFGVLGALADPQLTVHDGSTLLGGNDNWSSSANAAEVAAVAAQVAFPLPADSRDAALLLALPSGAYTVRVSGTAGTTGTALVEIYVLP